MSARQALQARRRRIQQGSRWAPDPLWQQSLFEPLERQHPAHWMQPSGCGSAAGEPHRRRRQPGPALQRRHRQSAHGAGKAISMPSTPSKRNSKPARGRHAPRLGTTSHGTTCSTPWPSKRRPFFDETMRIGRVFDLVNGEKVRAEFEREDRRHLARRGAPGERSSSTGCRQRRRRGAMSAEYLNRRSAQHAEQIVGQIGSEFEFNCQNLIASVGREAQRVSADTRRPRDGVVRWRSRQKRTGANGSGRGWRHWSARHPGRRASHHPARRDWLLSAGALAALGLRAALPRRKNWLKQQLRATGSMLCAQLC